MASGDDPHTGETEVIPLDVTEPTAPRETSEPPFAGVARVVCVVGHDAGRSFVLSEPRMVIGRGRDAQIALEGGEVSRRHAVIERHAHDYVIRDLGSRNGTSVNGRPVVGDQVLHPGDRIQIGTGTILLFALHDELESRAMRLQKLEGLATVTGGIVHDFKNTLSVVLANADLLARELTRMSGSADARSMIDDIRTAARQGLEHAKRLLYFSDRNNGSGGWTEVDLGDLVAGVVALMRRPLVTQAIQVEVDVGAGFVVRGSIDELRHAVLNVVVNARDAMPAGGRLHVRADVRTFARSEALQHHLPFAGAYIELVIEDTGVGMDAATQSRIFEPFFTTKGGEGTGLGLPTVYGIVRRHGGNVLVESALGRGTTVRILLPRFVADR